LSFVNRSKLIEMKLIIYPLFISCLLFFGCNSKAQEHNYHKEATLLNDSAVTMSFWGDTAKVMEAIKLLNEATDIQPDYYSAYWNKLMFQRQLGLMDDAFATLKVMEQIRSKNPDLKTMLGTFYEQYKQDTIQAMVKYREADLLYKSILDTITPNSLSYQSIITSYALNLKMLGKNFEADSILLLFIQNYYYNDKEEYKVFKQFIETNIIKKTREELINLKPADFNYCNSNNDD